MLAAFRYHERIVEVLIRVGADVFRQDNRGRTALCYAISTTIVKSLQPPFPLIDLLLTEMEAKGCSINDYLVVPLKAIHLTMKNVQLFSRNTWWTVHRTKR